MNKTHSKIAAGLRKKVGAHYTLLCSTPSHELTVAEYQAARSSSDQAVHLARYLAQHLNGVNRLAFCEASGIRGEA